MTLDALGSHRGDGVLVIAGLLSALAYVAIIGLILFRPQGLLGKREELVLE